MNQIVEFLKLLAAILTPLAAIVTAVITIVFAFLRKRDTRERDLLKERIESIEDDLKLIPAIERYLKTIADEFEMNVTHEQARYLLEMAFHTARLTVAAWVVSWFRAGKPAFQRPWQVSKTMKSLYYSTRTRLTGFTYGNAPLAVLLEMGEFDFIRDELEKALPACADEATAEKVVEEEFANIFSLVLERLEKGGCND